MSRKNQGLIVTAVAALIRHHQKKLEPPQGKDIRRVAEVMEESQSLVNNSYDLGVVARRYRTLVSCLEEFASRSKRDLDFYGISLGRPASQCLADLQRNKSTVFLQALDRSHSKCMKRVGCLKTQQGKENALSRFYDETCQIIGEYGLPDECFSHLERLYQFSMSEINK